MKIAVVGGGLSGLTAAYRLQALGHEVRVFESEPHVGGRMASVTIGGFTIDTGASLLLENYSHTKELARELGIYDQWMEFHASAHGGILRNGRLTSFAPQNALAVLGYRGLSWPARLRLLLFFVHARVWVKEGLDFFDLSVGEDVNDARDAESYCRAHLGDEVTDWIIDPFVRTFHFHGARRLSMKYVDALAALLVGQSGFVSRGFRRNMGTLSHALALKLKVSRGTPVTAITSAPDAVTVAFGDGHERFDSVVLATPATVANRLLTNAAPTTRALLGAVEYSSTLICAYRVSPAAAPDFEGVWVPYSESRTICFAANEARKGAADATGTLLVLGLHEEAARVHMGSPDAEVFGLVEREWCRLFPQFSGQLTGLHVHRWPCALPIYAPGHVARVRDFWRQGQGENRVWLCGDYLNHPWVEGSIHCGEKIAARIGAQRL